MKYISKLSKIQECIITMDMLCRNMNEAVEEIQERQIKPNSNVYKLVNRFNAIQLCSFMDELKILDSLSKDNEYLKDTLYIIAPSRRSFKNWPDIEFVRNKMFAHYNRDKQNNFYPWWITLKDTKIPEEHAETRFIIAMVKLITTIVLSRYYNDFRSAFALIKQEYDDCINYRSTNSNCYKDIEIQRLFSDIGIEVERRMKEKNADLYKVW